MSVAAVRIPDSTAARDAEALARVESSPMLYGHVLRSYFFAALLAEHDGTHYDEELLYVGCVLHDVGLTPRYDDPVRPCEHVSADVAAQLVERHEWDLRRRYELHRAIVMHMAPDISQAEVPEVRLLEAGVACDCTGARSEAVGRRAAEEVLLRYPRRDFKTAFTALLAREAQRKPACHAAVLMRSGLARSIADAPFP